MILSTVDILIVLAYLFLTIIIGLMMKKQAALSKENYMLGGNKLPWYLLGLSNASGMFDISGTMWLVTLAFVYGLKSIWIPWLWPVFNQVFLMVYLSVWLRRSNVATGAEWIKTRFGDGKDGRLSHIIVVVFALISSLGFLAYGFIGLGKFVEIFIPWEIVQPYIPFHVPEQFVVHVYGIAFTLFAVFYAVLGGMSSIVWTDVLQYSIMAVSSVVIAIIAMLALSHQQMVVPEGWHNPFFGWHLNMDWTGIIDSVNSKIKEDGYSLFSAFFMMMLFKGMLVSAAGPAPNYDMQKILSTKSPKEAAKMSAFVSVVLMPIRYLMISGFAVLAILYYDQLDLLVAGKIDFEQILPAAIMSFVPVGFLGLLLAGLLAAFMSTFAGTLNAAQAYIVNDIYLKFVNKEASKKQISNANYLMGILVVVVSMIFGVFAHNVNSILQWLVSALWGSYTASNILKWYWWRFNGSGFFWGMIAGIVPALIFPVFFPNILELYYFPAILIISLIGSIAGTYSKPATNEQVLMQFYKNVRPWGFWQPIKEKVLLQYPDFVENKGFKQDAFNIIIGIILQTLLVVLPIYVVLMDLMPISISIVLILIFGTILKKTWWDKLAND
jgi:Na+/proline symporter